MSTSQSAPAVARGHVVRADEGECASFFGLDIVIRASAESTGGAFSVLEETNTPDVPKHVHEDHDELFLILEGRHVITIGDEEFELGPGDIAFGPRGVPHAQHRVVPRTGRLLIMFHPAGFEGWFRDLARAEAEGRLDDEEFRRASEQYRVRWVD